MNALNARALDRLAGSGSAVRWAFAGALALALSACEGAPPPATPSATPSPLPRPTLTVTPTVTPSSTPTATPIVTPIPTGDPAVCSGAGGCAVFQPGEPILIGVAAPMTGDASEWGMDTIQAAQIALDDAGPFHDYTFALVSTDDRGEQNGAATVALNLTSDPAVVAVVGHSFSAVSLRAMPIYANKFVPMISPSGSVPSLTQQGNAAFNRVVSPYTFAGDVGAQFAAQNLALKRVAIIRANADWASPLAERVSAPLFNAGVTVITTEVFAPGQIDYTPMLRRVAALKPDGIFYIGSAPDGATIIAQMHAIGLEAAFIGLDTLNDDQFLETAGQYAEGVYSVSIGAPFSDARQKFDNAFLSEFKVVAGSRTSVVWFAYDATRALVEAIKAVAFQSDGALYIPRKALMDAVREIKDYQGLTGIITCDYRGECAAAPTFVVYRAQKGMFVQLPPDFEP